MLEVQNLSFGYDKKNILHNLDFLLAPGLVSLMGPNGSGKSTLLKILSGLLKNKSGKIKYFGEYLSSKPNLIKKKLGVLFQHSSHDEKLSAYENLIFAAKLYNISDYRKKIMQILEYANLTEQKNIILKKFSGGMKRRLELYRTFLHDPKILILDEPTEGLDDLETKRFLDFAKNYQIKNKALVLYSSHREQEICCAQNLIMLDKGQKIYQGSPEKLISNLNFKRLFISSNWGQEQYLKNILSSYIKFNNQLGVNYEFKISQDNLEKLFHSGLLFSPVVKSHRVEQPSIHDAFYEQQVLSNYDS